MLWSCNITKGKEKDKNKARREKIPKKRSESSIGRKEFTPTLVPIRLRVSIIKCFKCLGNGYIASECPSRHVMIVKEDRKIGSESSIGEISISSEFESLSDGSHYERGLLVVRRVINIQIGEEVETKRENIFHSMCLILGNLYSMIIDWGSCVNVASERLVKKLALPTMFHKKVIHDEVINHFIFIHLGQRVVLKPFSPREVQEQKERGKKKIIHVSQPLGVKKGPLGQEGTLIVGGVLGCLPKRLPCHPCERKHELVSILVILVPKKDGT
ncbi:hypothetical protein CR513_21139, partial [Mucuna pruriens]